MPARKTIWIFYQLWKLKVKITVIQRFKIENGKNIFCDGGAEIVNEFLKNKLIDEFIISIIPVFLGAGIRLFKNGRPEQKLKLVKTQSFETGLVQLHYAAVTSKNE